MWGKWVATSELRTAQGRPCIRSASSLASRPTRILLLAPSATRARIDTTRTDLSDETYGGV